MMRKTLYIILAAVVLMAVGCGKIRTCYCMDNSYYDIIDTALFDSVPIPISDNSVIYDRESAMECTYWSSRDTVGSYIPEYGIRTYYVFECWEK